MNRLLRAFTLCAAILVISVACSRQAEQAAQTAPPPTDPGPVSAESWVDNVQLKGPQGAESARDGFTPGELIELSMSVADAPRGTSVTTYWYGPDNRQLAYETKTVASNQQDLVFLQNNTFDWKGGEYRAEIWVGDEKVEEEGFRIVAG